MVLSAMSLMAAQDKTIYVNTFDDEDNTNPNKCSLREAVKAASLNKAYGGCSAGNTLNGQKDIIQLEAGEYKLEKEIAPTSQIIIQGKSPADWKQKSPLTNDYPLMGNLVSKISGQNKTRIFNTINSESALTLLQVELTQGYSKEDGGALYLAGPLVMNSSAITSSKSEKNGGAIYFVSQNTEKSLSLSRTLIEGNNAILGSVMAMDCEANLLSTKASIDVSYSSIVNNGNQGNSNSTLDFCGNSAVNLTANTIAKNSAAGSNGAIINTVASSGHPTSSSSSLLLNSNTIVENKAASTLYYDEKGTKALSFNVLAYNVGRSCGYSSANNVAIDDVTISAINNAIELTGSGECTLPTASTASTSNNINVSGISITSLLSAYQVASEYNTYLPLYYPKDNQLSNDLVDIGTTGCSDYDQRGLERVTDGTLILDPTLKNSCDIGSVELMRPTAADIVNLTNSSAVTLIDALQAEVDRLKALVTNKNTNSDYLIMYNDDLSKAESLLKYTKQYQGYRTIYVDPFKFALTDEVEVGTNGAKRLTPLDLDNYDVSAVSYGVGSSQSANASIDLSSIQPDSKLKCEWKPDLKRIMVYRLEDHITNSANSEYCKYTLKNKETGVLSTGLISARFTNIAPVANDDTYYISSSSNLEITVNPLENDNDDGDGSTSGLSFVKKPFYANPTIGEIPIQIEKLPAGLTVSAERQGPCPGNNAANICYGGKLHFTVKNNFSQFDYPVTYKVYDADEISSNIATIYLTNTVQNTNTSSSGGGGAFGLYGVFALLGLGLYRRYRMK
ncbi:hypothetical protein SFB21_1693 [Acinetobacter bouvetii]|uniref:CSLREA domain-containing protein n=2 Tax=Acinetobacter bouvetii TaxID=202951 RepID=A0A811GCP5_9GAMM|nr:hypothetical protein SFB21_1693 [Acinetobacter bouvetii]